MSGDSEAFRPENSDGKNTGARNWLSIRVSGSRGSRTGRERKVLNGKVVAVGTLDIDLTKIKRNIE